MIPKTMQTIEMEGTGGPEVLQMGERPVPTLSTGEVLVQTVSAGVNGPDILQRRGHYPPPKGASDMLGLEIAGLVVAVGSGVKGWAEGDPVCALTNGGAYAEFVAVNASHCLPIPKSISVSDAGGLCETYFTVWSNLFMGHAIDDNSLILIHGGAGGIGSTAIQLAKSLGHRVFTTCSGEVDLAFCKSLGAEVAIDYKTEDFVEILRAAGGANLILDIIGGDYIASNLKAAAPDARIVQLAFNAGSKVDLNLMPIMLKRLTLTGSTLRSRPDWFKTKTAKDLLKNVWPMFETGAIKPLTHAKFTFSEAITAHQMMEQGDHRGKILLAPNG